MVHVVKCYYCPDRSNSHCPLRTLPHVDTANATISPRRKQTLGAAATQDSMSPAAALVGVRGRNAVFVS